MHPVALAANLPPTFYAGSGRLARFRGVDLPPRPEDWIASTTSRHGRAPDGLSRLPDGTLLADAIGADPLAWLGADHVARHGADPALLVKLLDAGQRLPVHVHPSRSFAHTHLASPYGKTEAWLVLEAAPDAVVHLGFARDVSAEELASWVSEQDIAAMLDATNRVPVSSGDAFLCPAGTPHAIGPDVLLIELQEPTDLSVLLEWEEFGLDRQDALLGLPFEVALACVDRRRCAPDLLRGTPDALLPRAADEFFSAQRVGDGSRIGGFAVLVVTGGSGYLAWADGRLPIRRGDTLALPFAAGTAELRGGVEGVVCRSASVP